MLALLFEGWFQCRLPTDPDPSDELRGVSGWTFAVAGERDLDRIIRLQNPRSHRSHGPEVGVRVSRVLVHGKQDDGHPLLNAKVELLDDARFEGRNGIVAEDAKEPVHPFHLQVSGNGITLSREDILDPDNPIRAIHEVEPSVLARRQPTAWEANSPEVADATGILDPRAHRRRRRQQLERERAQTDDPTALAALAKRIRELAKPVEPRDPALATLSFRLIYSFGIQGPARVREEGQGLGGDVSTSYPWPVEFWMGGWDADALCAYMRGRLEVPFVGHT